MTPNISTILLSLFISGTTYAGSNLVLGRQDADIKSAEKDFGELMTSLDAATGTKGKLQVRRFPKQLAEDISKGDVTFLIDTVYPFASVDPNGDLVPALNVWKKGTEFHQGCIGALSTSKEDGKSFKGKRIILEEPYSTGSYALPLNIIMKSGVALNEINIVTGAELSKAGGKNLIDSASKYKAPADKVTVFFSNDESKSEEWLQAGAGDFVGIACKDIGDFKNIKKVAESEKLPRQLVAFHKNLDAGIRDKVIAFMKTLDGNSKELKAVKGTKVTALTQDQIASTSAHIKDWKKLYEYTEKVVGK